MSFDAYFPFPIIHFVLTKKTQVTSWKNIYRERWQNKLKYRVKIYFKRRRLLKIWTKIQIALSNLMRYKMKDIILYLKSNIYVKCTYLKYCITLDMREVCFAYYYGYKEHTRARDKSFELCSFCILHLVFLCFSRLKVQIRGFYTPMLHVACSIARWP